MIGVGISVVFWGMFMIPNKTKGVVESKVDPMVLQQYVAVAILLSSLLFLAKYDFKWSWWAVLSAALWTVCNILSITVSRCRCRA